MHYILATGLAILFFGLSACAAAPAPLPPLTTDTPTPSLTPTATIVWFPPTATFTPLPSVTPDIRSTQDQRASHGALIFEDDFSQPDLWSSGKQSAGTIAFGQGELSLGVSQPEGYLSSLRAGPPLDDFFLEITASPSICRDGDEYGVLLRASSAADFFRFGFNCRGEARVDRVISGTGSASQPPMMSGAIPRGAPSTSRLGVWASGKEMRFYANGEYLFTVRDGSILSGSLGLFARAAGTEAMTVNFSDLTVYQAAP